MPDHLKPLVKAAEAAGWTYDRTRKDHPRLSPPPGLIDKRTGQHQAPIIFASTPSDRRGPKNGYAALRRAGVNW